MGFFLIISLLFCGKAQAFVVYDPTNAALNSIRNALMQSQYLENLRIFLSELQQLKDTYTEFLRVNFGVDEIKRLIVGDLSAFGGFLNGASDTRMFNLGYEAKQSVRSLIRVVEGESSANPRQAFEEVYGKDPASLFRPDLTYEDIRALNALRLSAEMMKEAKITKEAGRSISEASLYASPKGAARLSADAMGKLLQVTAGTQESLSRLVELQANQLARQSMEEKHAESARLKFMEDFQDISQRLENARWERS